MKPYYDDGTVAIYHGDCREITWPSSASALLVTDPPYGISLNNDWQNEIHAKRRTANNQAVGGFANDEGQIAATLFSSHERRVIFGFPYIYDSAAAGWLVWDKEPGFTGRSLTSPIEMAYATTWRGFKAIRHLWSGYMRAPDSETKLGHPTQKPEVVMRTIIGWHDDALIFDPFVGSGTTLRAAKDLGRRAIGIEIEERYCEMAALRMGQEVLDLGVTVPRLKSCRHIYDVDGCEACRRFNLEAVA